VADAKTDWRRYAAPTAFLAFATVAIVLVASALHHARKTQTTPTTTAARVSLPSPRPAKTTKGAHGRRFYSVVAGDTFGVIATKTGTTVAELERLNPGVSSTSLHIGQKLRVA
jgi:LysM repeat protein